MTFFILQTSCVRDQASHSDIPYTAGGWPMGTICSRSRNRFVMIILTDVLATVSDIDRPILNDIPQASRMTHHSRSTSKL